MGGLTELLDSVKPKHPIEVNEAEEILKEKEKELGTPVYLLQTDKKYFYPSKCELIHTCRKIERYDDDFNYVNLYRSKNKFYIVSCDYGGDDDGNLFSNSKGKQINPNQAARYGFGIKEYLDEFIEIDYN